VRAKYVFDAYLKDANEFIRDYRAIEPLFNQQYGNPKTNVSAWSWRNLRPKPAECRGAIK
jgi:hypothetical protein